MWVEHGIGQRERGVTEGFKRNEKSLRMGLEKLGWQKKRKEEKRDRDKRVRREKNAELRYQKQSIQRR